MTLPQAREAALSLSAVYERAQKLSPDGVQVELYWFNDPPSDGGLPAAQAAQRALDATVESIDLYSDLFSLYPYSRFVIVAGDFPDGMEFSGIGFVGNGWFKQFGGGVRNYLTIITVHEVAHQWWYARVGSDQAQTPWLDEALSTYSEWLYYNALYPEALEWWWATRIHQYVQPWTGTDGVGSPVYTFTSARAYINAVYLRGAVMLDELRRELGNDVFYAWLRQYAADGDGSIVTPDRLWQALPPLAQTQVAPLQAEYGAE